MQATVLLVGRQIRVVRTNTKNGFTLLESKPGSEYLAPFTIAYYQVG